MSWLRITHLYLRMINWLRVFEVKEDLVVLIVKDMTLVHSWWSLIKISFAPFNMCTITVVDAHAQARIDLDFWLFKLELLIDNSFLDCDGSWSDKSAPSLILFYLVRLWWEHRLIFRRVFLLLPLEESLEAYWTVAIFTCNRCLFNGLSQFWIACTYSTLQLSSLWFRLLRLNLP